MTVRLFFFLLVFANLLFYAWSQGHFGTVDENREPQRLAAQMQADKLRILRNAPAAAKQPAQTCRIINGLTQAEAESLKAAMKSGGAGEAILQPTAELKPHLVVIAELANKAAAEKKVAELARFGVTEQVTVALDDGRHEIVLGAFASEAAAREFLQSLMKRGIKSARVDSRDVPAAKTRIEARGPEAELLRQLPLLIAPYAEATIGDCPP